MRYAGVDLHKKTLSVCVVDRERSVIERAKLRCDQPQAILEFVPKHRPLQLVVEATAGYRWLFALVERDVERLVLAHPRKLRIIAESTRKSDRLDAQVLAEFLALDMIPEAYRPTPREHGYRVLVRHRQKTQGRITSVKNRLRRVLADCNRDFPRLFTRAGLAEAQSIPLEPADRFVFDELHSSLLFQQERLRQVDRELAEYRAAAGQREQAAQTVLASIPQVGPVTIDTILSELGDVRRFRNAKQVCAWSGLIPVQRESAGRRHDGGITKEGSSLLRWTLVEAAWRLVGSDARWGSIFESLNKRCGKKKAIVAVARKLLCVIYAMLRDGTAYDVTRPGIRPSPRS